MNDEMTYNNKFFTNIKDSSEELIVGIDEAGRGPVIGPMVYAIYVCKEKDINKNLKDSKMLTAVKREALFSSLENYAYYSISPVYITGKMENNVLNLNEIALEAMEKLLAEVKGKCKNISTVYIDALGNTVTLRKKLESKFNLNIVVEKKADQYYKVVSGASIVAKVVRDSYFKNLNCGSGYPSDPLTIAWLKKHFNSITGLPNCVRHSWATVKKMFPIFSKKKNLLSKGKRRLKKFYLY